jgi:hypothetical protein
MRTHHRFSVVAAAAPWLSLLTSVSACSGSRAPDAAAPAAAVAPAGGERAADVPAAADAADPSGGWAGAPLLDRARARVGASVAVVWPGAGGFDDVVAFAGVSRRAHARAQDRVVSWFREGDVAPPPDAREYPVGPFAPTALATLDVNGDGRAELLAFGEGAGVQGGAAGSVLVFDLPPERDQALHLIAASAALDGARDVDQARARLPLSRGLGLDDIGTSSVVSLLGRLSFATAAQLRAVLAPGGVDVCALSASRGRTIGRQCRRLTGRATDAVLLRDVRQEIENAFADSVLDFTCESTARGDVCRARHAAGGQLQEFTFSGVGAARRLARVQSTDFPDAGE